MPDSAAYTIVASVIIAVMFVLFVKAARRNLGAAHSTSDVTSDADATPANTDNVSVYPVYVDCLIKRY